VPRACRVRAVQRGVLREVLRTPTMRAIRTGQRQAAHLFYRVYATARLPTFHAMPATVAPSDALQAALLDLRVDTHARYAVSRCAADVGLVLPPADMVMGEAVGGGHAYAWQRDVTYMLRV